MVNHLFIAPILYLSYCINVLYYQWVFEYYMLYSTPCLYNCLFLFPGRSSFLFCLDNFHLPFSISFKYCSCMRRSVIISKRLLVIYGSIWPVPTCTTVLLLLCVVCFNIRSSLLGYKIMVSREERRNKEDIQHLIK